MQPNPKQPSRLERIRTKLRAFLTNPLALFATSVVIVILIVVIAIIINLYLDAHDRRITITNLTDYAKNVPTSTKDDLENAVFRAAENNSPDDTPETTLSRATATIRSDTFVIEYNRATKIYSGNFIVDLPSLEQNYRIYYSYSTDNLTTAEQLALLGDPAVSVACLNPTEYNYPYYNCLAPLDDPSTAKIRYLDNLLPYSGETATGVPIYAAKVQYTTGGDPFVRLNVGACNNESELAAGLATFESYVESYNLTPSDYTILTSSTCDGEAS